jgi:predicted restriction endonuclease
MPRVNWQRHELLLALNLYCRLPFGQYHSRNPEIIELAELINRTPDAVAMKLSNLASLDPYHQSRGVKGLQNASQADRDIWNEFNSHWANLAVESELAYAVMSGSSRLENEMAQREPAEAIDVPFTGPTEEERQVKIRLGQSFFRKMILTSYSYECCICGMPIREMLVASHIIPWRDNEDVRVNPYNGLCLCTLHDRGFDRGLLTLGKEYEVIISGAIRKHFGQNAVDNGFQIYEGRNIALPDKFIPNQDFLEVHRAEYFLG